MSYRVVLFCTSFIYLFTTTASAEEASYQTEISYSRNMKESSSIDDNTTNIISLGYLFNPGLIQHQPLAEITFLQRINNIQFQYLDIEINSNSFVHESNAISGIYTYMQDNSSLWFQLLHVNLDGESNQTPGNTTSIDMSATWYWHRRLH